MICKKCGVEVHYKPTLWSRLFGFSRQACPKCGESVDFDTENKYGALTSILIPVLAGAFFFAAIGGLIHPYVVARWQSTAGENFNTTAVRLSGAGWGALLGGLLGLYIGIRRIWKR